jgi:signal transduction histidine kinase
VSVGYSKTALDIQVDDDGPIAVDAARRPTTEGSGRGLIGMRERVAVFGGEFSAAPAGRGFRVAARLPLGGTAA